MAILFPLVIVTVLAIVQVVLWAHANNVAQAAADHGAETAAAFGSTEEQGRIAALAFIQQAGHVSAERVEVAKVGSSVRVEITGAWPSIFGQLAVHAESTQPSEVFDP